MTVFLQKGDLIDIVAPAAGYKDFDEDKMRLFIRELGFECRFPKELQKFGADPFSAHDLSTRLANLKNALLAEDSKAVWCFRGGYGSSLLIQELEKIDFSSVKKPIIGFSDITALHIYFVKKYKLTTIHGRTLNEYFNKDIEQDEILKMRDLLLGKDYDLEIAAANNLAKNISKISGSIIGGNLVLVENSLATNWQIDCNNKILLLEDAFERGYRIDRSMEHLKQAGIFDKAKAVIIGNILCAKEQDGSFKCEDAISRFIDQAKIPVFRTNKIGHGEVNNPVIFGKAYDIVRDKKFILRPAQDD